MLGDTTESRKNWIAASDRLGVALEPGMVAADQRGLSGHPPRRSKTPSIRRTSIGCRKPLTSDQELFDQMTELYPHWVAELVMVDVRSPQQ